MSSFRDPLPGLGGVVLCGGRSSRMGQPKAWLEFRGEPLLTRVVRQLDEVVSPLVVVAAADQSLPPLPAHVPVVRDRQPDRGPLEGLYVGLTQLAHHAPAPPAAALVTSCDAPLWMPAVVRLLAAALTPPDDAVVPDDGQHLYPLAAVYRLSVAASAEWLLAHGQHRLVDLCAAITTRRLPTAALRAVDPELRSLVNVNDPESLRDALRSAER